MENSAVQKVNQEIYRRYPEFSGVRPEISPLVLLDQISRATC